MSKVIPFRALIPDADVSAAMVSPPFDTVDMAEARRIAESNPHSFLHITKAQVDLAPDAEECADEVYQKAAKNLARFQDLGLLVEHDPAFYVYRQVAGENFQTGLVCGISVEDYEGGLIRRHERVREDKVADRACHAYVTGVHAEPAMLVHRSSEAIFHLINETEARVEPLIDVTDASGVRHLLWRAKNTVALQRVFEGVDFLYIADGHHLCASALRVRDIMKKANPHHRGTEAYNYFPAVIYPDDEVRIFESSWEGDPARRPLSSYSMGDIMLIADDGTLMPPHSTWFAPKPGSGLFVYKFRADAA